MLSFGFVLLGFLFFFGGFKGQVRWPKGPPHLAPSSCCCFINQVSTFQFLLFLLLWVSLVLLCVVFWIYFCFGFLSLFFGGFKGQVRWPKGPPHLALNPPY